VKVKYARTRSESKYPLTLEDDPITMMSASARHTALLNGRGLLYTYDDEYNGRTNYQLNEGCEGSG
jgi:hypothetical protein